MVRHLLLVRHAKSSWDEPALSDRERPLARRGVDALPRLHRHLTDGGLRPDLVLCSPARRTVDTLAGIRGVLAEPARIETDEWLYLTDADSLLTRLRELADDLGCAMVVGHNPTLRELSLRLVGGGDEASWAQVRNKLPTGAIVTLSFDGEWSELADGRAHLDDLFVPRPPRDPGAGTRS